MKRFDQGLDEGDRQPERQLEGRPVGNEVRKVRLGVLDDKHLLNIWVTKDSHQSRPQKSVLVGYLLHRLAP